MLNRRINNKDRINLLDESAESSSDDENSIRPYDDNSIINDLLRTATDSEQEQQQQQDAIVTVPSIIAEFKHNMPLDKFNSNYFIFYLLGVTTMCPWNFFVTAEDYWLYKFRNATANCSDLTPMQKSFTSDLTMTAAYSGTIFLILNAVYGHLVSLKFKMLGSMTIIFFLFILTTVFVEINTDTWQSGFFLVTLGTVVIINSFSAVMSGALFGIAGLFPSEFMTAVVSGQALGGILTALALILTLTFGLPPKTTAFAYFSIGNSIILLSIISYAFVERSEFFQYFVYEKSKALIIDSPSTSNSNNEVNIPELKIIFPKIFLYSLIICIVFAQSLSVYPAITVLIQSQYHGNGHPWNDIYFVPVANYLIFNCGDYLGRILAGFWEVPKSNAHTVLLFTFLRFGFIPIFMLSNVAHVYLPTFIKSDLIFIILIALFALSNGYLANISLINVPKIVMQHEKEMASSIMAASLSLGLALGASCSMVLVQIL